ncbi:MAG TPA: hypothetical protein PLD88_14140, partial [Candidatus Berkiella sp.]|nr:hypothetical protein [Candidatus Berkiella sp.]
MSSISISMKSPTAWLLGLDRFIPAAFIPDALYNSTQALFWYKNEKELITLNHLLSLYDDTIRFSSSFEESVQTDDNKIPPYVGKYLVENLPKHNITKLTVDDKLISPSQKKQLAVISEKAEQKKKNELSRMGNGILIGIGLFAFAAAMMAAIGMSLTFSLMLKGALVSGMMSGVISHIRNIYLDTTQYYYQKNGQIVPPDNTAEKQAYHFGEQA